jgi:acyl dehydratase
LCEVKVTEAMLNAFKDLSGDEDPLHVDAAFARAREFKDRLAYGIMLTASFFSTLVGIYLPGERALLQAVDASFGGPVFTWAEIKQAQSLLHEMMRRDNAGRFADKTDLFASLQAIKPALAARKG